MNKKIFIAKFNDQQVFTLINGQYFSQLRFESRTRKIFTAAVNEFPIKKNNGSFQNFSTFREINIKGSLKKLQLKTSCTRMYMNVVDDDVLSFIEKQHTWPLIERMPHLVRSSLYLSSMSLLQKEKTKFTCIFIILKTKDVMAESLEKNRVQK